MKRSWISTVTPRSATALGLVTLALLAGCHSAPPPRQGVPAVAVPVAPAATVGSPGAAIRLGPLQARAELLQEQAELVRALQSSPVSLLRSEQALRLTVPVWQLFAADSLALKPDPLGIAPVPQLLAVLRAHPAARLQIRVYTDSIGGDVVNQALSRSRGQVLLTLFQSAGIAAARLQLFAVGDASPVASNRTPEGRRQNRRIELTLLPQ